MKCVIVRFMASEVEKLPHLSIAPRWEGKSLITNALILDCLFSSWMFPLEKDV